MDMMKPIASTEKPRGEDWLYEVKYDGFRCVLQWEDGSIRLTSKNNKDLTANFPEIVAFCRENEALVKPFLPLQFDGELVVLNNAFQADFASIQKRGRLKNKASIQEAAEFRPASLLVFDLLQYKGSDCRKDPLVKRKSLISDFSANTEVKGRINFIQTHDDADELGKIIFDYKAEGMIAKRQTSTYQSEKDHRDWFKIKNWRTIHGFLTHFNPENDYFTVSIYDNDAIKEIGKCKHGLDSEAFQTLQQIFTTKGEKEREGYSLPPAICASIHTLDLYKEELREPEFDKLLPNMEAAACTLERLQLNMAMLPPTVDLTNTDKIFWPDDALTKGDLLIYIREIAPYMIPFLKDRALTIIRSPDGVKKEHFFQKHLPDYAPSFIDSFNIDDERRIICNGLDSLVWFANHGAVEYHIPFQTVQHDDPSEIVFDLDPPDRDRFDLAIQAAKIIKALLDDLDLISFVKTSGNKGLQIHIPIPTGSMTYEETGVFTEAIARTVENAYPNLFTTERMKKNRNGRLYIDYLQHGKDKTLIAPYSPRKTDDATIAAPLFWEEVKEGLDPGQFTIENAIDRVKRLGCPFGTYFDVGMEQRLERVLSLVRGY
ncbi:DNA ligase D [Virgibacillus sp. NKC19-16]|uniref:DNA ligase D n=1 Tax=Virgibacillus salidurans TaxID=2831673 RepID=UPI001EFF99E6|nr:DNA ligase D [Virgibacillus sp. NKC19-16]UJL46035.1 DNA ligase D [Virgibacillus sp. NKC19-16]